MSKISQMSLTLLAFFKGNTVDLPEEENTPEKRVDRIFAMMDKVRICPFFLTLIILNQLIIQTSVIMQRAVYFIQFEDLFYLICGNHLSRLTAKYFLGSAKERMCTDL